MNLRQFAAEGPQRWESLIADYDAYCEQEGFDLSLVEYLRKYGAGDDAQGMATMVMAYSQLERHKNGKIALARSIRKFVTGAFGIFEDFPLVMSCLTGKPVYFSTIKQALAAKGGDQ